MGQFNYFNLLQGFVSFVVIMSVAPLVVDFLAFTRVEHHESYNKVTSRY
jgi:hypothetical protein